MWPEWWHLFLWNATADGWDVPGVGASDLALVKGDAIAWYLAVDDPVTYVVPRPVPSPDFRDVWTSFRGDLSNTGRARGRIPASNALLWDHDVGIHEIDTAPVVAYGNVFVATRNALVALDAATGQERWRNPGVHSLLSTPAVYDGHLVLGGTDGKLHYVNARNGSEEWSVLVEPGASSTGIASSPAVFDGRAYVGTFNESVGGKGQVVAVNLNNGTIAWSYDAPGVVHQSTPAVLRGNLYVGVMGTYDGVVGYAAPYGLLSLTIDGAYRWFFGTNGSVASSPAIRNGIVFTPTAEGWMYAFDETGREVWASWTAPSTGSPAIVDDHLYLGTGVLDGPGWIFDVDDIGVKHWYLGASGGFQASLVADDRLVCGSTNEATGRILCFERANGNPVWEYAPSPADYILGSPIAVGGVLYAPSDNGHVYAFGRSSPEPVPLLAVEVVAPATVHRNEAFDVVVQVESLNHARANNVSLSVTLPAGLARAGEPDQAAEQDRTITFPIEEVLQGASSYISFGARLVSEAPFVSVRASVDYRDVTGQAYPQATDSAVITL
ncbi:MAG TPA: PQQ-binding-like beta-propeller repeat protein, partial [Thermoplasmata archaeon]|nr:PQQ-binding-like beta-propeller repeat protein [Thermoplasmata archaeon]